nr:uncharacterized protein LOC111414039 [Onthophagus taurus]
MSYEAIIDHLKVLNSQNLSEYPGDLNELLTKNIESTITQVQLNDTIFILPDLKPYEINDNFIIWKYICFNSYLFKELGETLKDVDTNLLSVHQNKLLQKSFDNYINLGICANLLPNMSAYHKISIPRDENLIINQYKMLAATTSFLIYLLKYPKLRLIILSSFSKPLLNALYQIIHCPLKKPSTESTCNFVMSEEIYNWLLEDKEKFKKSFDYLVHLLNKKIYVHNTMMLITPKSPKWLKSSVSQTLDNILVAPQGVESTLWAMLEYKVDSFEMNDRTKNWETLEILTKLILNFYNKPEFDGLCNQLINLLNKRDNNKKITTFEDLYCLCVKQLYLIDKEVCKKKLLCNIFDQLNRFCYENTKKFVDNEDITGDIEHNFRLIYNCFIGKSLQTTDLPIILIKKYLNVFFNFYIISLDSPHGLLKNQLEDILLKYMKNSDSEIFDNFLFDLQPNEIALMRRDIFIEIRGKSVFVKVPQSKIKINIGRKGDVLIKLCRKNEDLYISLFLYYMRTLKDTEKYFKLTTNLDLLKLEDEVTLDEVTERKLMVFQNLSALAEDVLIQEHINENPKTIIDFLKDSLTNILTSNIHKSLDFDSDDFQNVFTTVMILQALVMNSTKENLKYYKTLSEIVHTLFCETLNIELKQLLKTIDNILCNDDFKQKSKKVVKSEVDKALDDITDPLLPVRGHGLLVLSKLIEKRDKEIMERKNYVLNVFQQNLKDEDSFIYLTSIGGLAAMADVFPDIIIKILTEEYSDFSKKENEIRMKLGEILVRVTKNLGEMAPKYKSVLLNTFLVGTKDEDHLIRASSLSNLGEICKVLGYKLGSIVTEVLVCVHSIITTDKAVEARRAAVTVIRQLLAGLEVEMVVFLKDHILEIYRTLKNIYNNDKDDIMRLQAQLGLEELNENMKDFVFPKPTLNIEKKLVVLN